MIPKIIHYVWIGPNAIPANKQQSYMESWHQMMPNWEIRGWTETNIPVEVMEIPYVKQAYEAKKYAFVSDYVRLWALEQYGGVYMDTDVEVIRSFDELPEFNSSFHQSINPSFPIKAFIGFEESLAHLPGTCVMGCEAHCQWVRDMLATYNGAEFIKSDGTYDLLTNVQRMGKAMIEQYGLIPNGKEQIINKQSSISNKSEALHVYDHHHFSPITSTRVMRKTKDTFAIHHFAASWHEQKGLLAKMQSSPIVCEILNALIQIKRFIKKYV